MYERDERDAKALAAARAMIPRIDRKPCVNIDACDRTVYVCRQIRDLCVTDEGVIEGYCDWMDPSDKRPDELTDGLAIGCDCLVVGNGWWLDTYFNWYFVFDPPLVSRSLSGDHSWVANFLETTGSKPPGT